jgi:hypothetical protein
VEQYYDDGGNGDDHRHAHQKCSLQIGHPYCTVDVDMLCQEGPLGILLSSDMCLLT